MNALGTVLGIILLVLFAPLLLVIVGLPPWVIHMIGLFFLLAVLAYVDRKAFGGAFGRGLARLAAGVWLGMAGLAARKGWSLPTLPVRQGSDADEPWAVYEYLVPAAGWFHRAKSEYVGSSNDPYRRHSEHVRDNRPFIRPGVKCNITWYPNERIALAVEQRTIGRGTLYNIVWNPDRPRPVL